MRTCARITFDGWRISWTICCESSEVTRSPDPERAPVTPRYLRNRKPHMRTVQNTSPIHPWNRVIRTILADMTSSVDML